MVEIGARQGANRSEVGYLARICNAAWRRFSAIFNNELLTHQTKSALAAVLAVAAQAGRGLQEAPVVVLVERGLAVLRLRAGCSGQRLVDLLVGAEMFYLTVIQ